MSPPRGLWARLPIWRRSPRQLGVTATLNFSRSPAGGGSDHAACVCHGATGFSPGALNWEYGTCAWHTNRDTSDKVVFDDLMRDATLSAMLVYLASGDPNDMSRDRRVMPPNQQGVQ